MRKLLLTAPKASKPGPSGLRLELLTVLDNRKPGIEETLLASLTRFINSALAGGLPQSLQPYLCGGRLIPVKKKDNGLRPVVAGEVLRSIVARAALMELAAGISDLQPLQVGVGGSGPWAQTTTASVRSWVTDMLHGNPNVLVKVDLKNAFNSIRRRFCVAGVQKYAPGLATWSHWCLSQTSLVFWQGAVVACAAGVQQGNSLAPAPFAAGIHDIVETLAR